MTGEELKALGRVMHETRAAWEAARRDEEEARVRTRDAFVLHDHAAKEYWRAAGEFAQP